MFCERSQSHSGENVSFDKVQSFFYEFNNIEPNLTDSSVIN